MMTAPPLPSPATSRGEHPFNYMPFGAIGSTVAERPYHCNVAVVARAHLATDPAERTRTGRRAFTSGRLSATREAHGYTFHHPGFPEGTVFISDDRAVELPGIMNVVFQ